MLINILPRCGTFPLDRIRVTNCQGGFVKLNTATIVVLTLIVLITFGGGAFLIGEQWRLLWQGADSPAEAETLAGFRQTLMFLAGLGTLLLAGTLLAIFR